MIRNTKLAASISIALLAGTSGNALAQVPAPNSAEFRAQYTLAPIQVTPVWQQGALGQGVVVAVLDTGVNASHFELKGRIAPGGKNFVEGGNGAPDLSADGHGTSMAGIIASNFNNRGMVGVAYQSQILPVRVVQSGGSVANEQNRTAAINYVANRPEVRVMVSAYHNVGRAESEVNALKNAAANNKVVVISAGNKGGSNPLYPASAIGALGGSGIIVGGTQEGRVIWDESNRAGNLRNHYIVAPAVGINGPTNSSNSSFRTWNGTSMAAPQVAGAAALLLSHAPNLTSQQVVQLLLTNADDLGAPGVDPIYGHGFLNVAAALQAQGGLEGPSDDSSSSSGLAAGAAALAVGAGVVYWLTQKDKTKKQLENTLVLDSYNRPYVMNMNNFISVRDRGPELFDVMDMFDRQSRTMDIPLSKNMSASMYTSTINPSEYFFLKDSDPFMELDEQIQTESLSLKLKGEFENGLSFNIMSNQAPGSDFDKVNGMSLSENFIMGGSLGNSYMGFGSSADSMSVGYRYNSRYSFSVGANRIDDNETYGLKSNTSAVQGTYQHNERNSLSLRLSEIREQGSMFGGASDGVLSVSRSKTTALGLTANHKLMDKLTLFANYTHGFTNVDEQRGSFLKDFTGLQSYSYSMGVIGNNLVGYNDKAGFAFSSPMRVSDGDVTLVVPHAIDYSANEVLRSSTRLDMSDVPAELDFEAFYNRPVNKHANVGTYLTYRDRPATESNDGDEVAVFATVGMKF